MESKLQASNPVQRGEIHSTRIDNKKVNYLQQGEGDPVILTHGLAASLHDWDDLLPELASAGYTGYTLDLLGHGESHKPDDHAHYTVDSVFAHFEEWIESLNRPEPMIMIGHSLGGGLSLMYALRHPERVRALVLVNPFYHIKQLPLALQSVFLKQLLNTRILSLTPYPVFRFFVDMTSFQYYIGHRESHILPEHIRYQTALDYKRASTGIYNIPRTLPDITLDLSKLNQPTLLLWGNRDQTLAPASFEELARSIPNLKGTHTLPVCGHVPHQCHPEVFNPYVMNFLKTV
jgi:pimeloyl-ACP methyl ester carboxylesterase